MRIVSTFDRRTRLGFALLLITASVVTALADEKPSKRVAAIVTEYPAQFHADVIVGRLLLTDMLDGFGTRIAAETGVALHRSEAAERYQPTVGGLATLPDQDQHCRRPHARHRQVGGGRRLAGCGTRQLPVLRLQATINIPNDGSGKRRSRSSAKATASCRSSSTSIWPTIGKTPNIFMTPPRR